MNLEFALLKSLSTHQFISLETLSRKLSISMHELLNYLEQLQAHGAPIAIEQQNIKLIHPIIFLDKDCIKNNLPQSIKKLIQSLELFSSIPSTHQYLKQQPHLTKDTVKICLAEMQTAAKARLAKSWYSPIAANIYFSSSWWINKGISYLSGITLIIALGLIRALHEYGVKDNLAIKWPNDIYWQNKKLVGILVEVNTINTNECQLIISFGINTNMLDDANMHIHKPWTSLMQITQQYHDRNPIISLVISHLFLITNQFLEQGFSFFLDEWQSYDYLKDKMITMDNGHEQIQGKAIGINKHGLLVLTQEDGSAINCSAGEASILSIN